MPRTYNEMPSRLLYYIAKTFELDWPLTGGDWSHKTL